MSTSTVRIIRSRRINRGDRHRAVYQIEVQGELDTAWKEWFDELAIVTTYAAKDHPTTTLLGSVPDQAALRGILCKLWDLNLTLLSIRRVEAGDKEEYDSE